MTKKKTPIAIEVTPKPMAVWKVKQGNTAIVEGFGRLILSKITPEKKYYLECMEDNSHFVFGYYNGNAVELYSFGKYDSNVLPSHLLSPFVGLLPSGVDLIRPEPVKKARVFNESPLR